MTWLYLTTLLLAAAQLFGEFARRDMASRLNHLEQRVANLERAREEDRKS